MIEFRSVTKQYPDGTLAVDDFSLVIPSRKTTVFVGSSGCGKTTILRMINRMVDPTSGVIEIDGKASKRNRTARVANPRLDTVSREVLRHDEFKDRVALGRQRDHFIFSVESAGQYPPEELFVEAGRVLLGKIDVARRSLLALLDQFSNDL